jgi:hypothetical protein
MALQIDHFSPPKESSWERKDVFGASGKRSQSPPPRHGGVFGLVLNRGCVDGTTTHLFSVYLVLSVLCTMVLCLFAWRFRLRSIAGWGPDGGEASARTRLGWPRGLVEKRPDEGKGTLKLE